VAGYNTDGAGALAALRHAGLGDLLGARVLVLGAGPTARATIAALLAAGTVVSIWNRSRAKADAIVRTGDVRLWRATDAPDAVFSSLPPGAIPGNTTLLTTIAAAPLVIDANYGPRATLGALLGRDVADGAAMLAASARASFAFFRSVL